jgi:hypothetical protein
VPLESQEGTPSASLSNPQHHGQALPVSFMPCFTGKYGKQEHHSGQVSSGHETALQPQHHARMHAQHHGFDSHVHGSVDHIEILLTAAAQLYSPGPGTWAGRSTGIRAALPNTARFDVS